MFRLAISQALHEARQGGPGQAGGEAALVRLVDRLLERAVACRASDLHIEPGEQGVRLRYRCDGLLREDMQRLPAELAPLIASRLKVMAGMDIAKRQLPQDGHIRYESGTRRIDMRVSSLPAADGEVLVLRLMNLEEKPLELDELGFTAENLVREVRRLVTDENYRARMQADYAGIREKLGGTGASDAVAEAMVAELRK